MTPWPATPAEWGTLLASLFPAACITAALITGWARALHHAWHPQSLDQHAAQALAVTRCPTCDPVPGRPDGLCICTRECAGRRDDVCQGGTFTSLSVFTAAERVQLDLLLAVPRRRKWAPRRTGARR